MTHYFLNGVPGGCFWKCEKRADNRHGCARYADLQETGLDGSANGIHRDSATASLRSQRRLCNGDDDGGGGEALRCRRETDYENGANGLHGDKSSCDFDRDNENHNRSLAPGRDLCAPVAAYFRVIYALAGRL